jgi:hypothetical protein
VDRTDYTTLPDEPCDICAEKHFSLAKRLMQELGYEAPNRQDIIGELTAATWHTFKAHRAIAEKMRDLRHKIQLRLEPELVEWNGICMEFEKILKPHPAQYLCSERTFPNFKETVWVISNCDYPQNKLVPVGEDDILVFLNKAKSLAWYNHQHKVVFHRSPEESYGTNANNTAEHFYCFKGKEDTVQYIPPASISKIKAEYDWNYPIEQGKVRSATTGFMVVKHLQKVLPHSNIMLVNFGYKVEKSSYRCPWHNWTFEAKELDKLTHFYTAEVSNE